VKLLSVAIAEISVQRSHELRRLIESEADIKVIAELHTPHQALSVVFDQLPDLLLLSARLLEGGGLDAIELIMAERPTGILILEEPSQAADENSVQQALRRGALHREQLPARQDHEGAAQLRALIRRLARVPVVRHILSRSGGGASSRSERSDSRSRFPDSTSRTPPPRRIETGLATTGKSLALLVRRSHVRPALIALGASIGGPNILADILRPLPASLAAAIVVVQHLPPGFAEPFADYLRSHIALPVHVVQQTMAIQRGCVYLAADTHHVIAATRGTLTSDDGPPLCGHRPSVDQLFLSVAQSYGESAIGVLLTGLGSDGSQGLLAMRQSGAVTIAQDAETSVVDGMPRAARESGAAEFWLSPTEISTGLLFLCDSETPPASSKASSSSGGGSR
jgi:two-component system chemotaxis response regulator CheB